MYTLFLVLCGGGVKDLLYYIYIITIYILSKEENPPFSLFKHERCLEGWGAVLRVLTVPQNVSQHL